MCSVCSRCFTGPPSAMLVAPCPSTLHSPFIRPSTFTLTTVIDAATGPPFRTTRTALTTTVLSVPPPPPFAHRYRPGPHQNPRLVLSIDCPPDFFGLAGFLPCLPSIHAFYGHSPLSILPTSIATTVACLIGRNSTLVLAPPSATRSIASVALRRTSTTPSLQRDPVRCEGSRPPGEDNYQSYTSSILSPHSSTAACKRSSRMSSLSLCK